METNGKWGNGLGNGTGLMVTEMDHEGRTDFSMHPELFFDSYLPTLQVGARDIDEQSEPLMYIGSWLDDRRGLVTVMARPE